MYCVHNNLVAVSYLFQVIIVSFLDGGGDEEGDGDGDGGGGGDGDEGDIQIDVGVGEVDGGAGMPTSGPTAARKAA